MNRMFRRTHLLITVTALLAIAGCAKTPTPTFYQLEEPVGARLSGIERGIAIGVELLNLPAYLDRPQIVTRATTHTLELSESNVWVEPLKNSMLRVLIVNLSNMLNTNRVFRVPRRDKGIPLEIRVVVDIARFDGNLGGDVYLTARWTLYNQKKKALQTRVSIISEPVGGQGYDELITAQNRTLQALASEIAEAIKSNTY